MNFGCREVFSFVMIVDPRPLVNPGFKVAHYTLPQEIVIAGAKFFPPVF